MTSLSQIATGLAVAATTAYFVANNPMFHKGANGFGSCTTAAEVMKDVDLRGKVAVVTGAASGIGFETALALAKAGCKLYLPCRSMDKAREAALQLNAAAGSSIAVGNLIACVCDLGDLASVREFTRFVRKANEPIDLLVCNAGIMALPTRTATPQGLEAQMATNHLAHALIVKQLMPQLLRAKNGARVVNVSSIAHRSGSRAALLNDRLESPSYEPWTAYGNSKLANIVHARELQERFGHAGVTAFSLHPGGIWSGLQSHVPTSTLVFWTLVSPFFFKSVAQGAATSLFCAAHPTAIKGAGKYHVDCNPAPTSTEEIVNDADLRKSFWDTTERLIAPFVDLDVVVEGAATSALNKLVGAILK